MENEVQIESGNELNTKDAVNNSEEVDGEVEVVVEADIGVDTMYNEFMEKRREIKERWEEASAEHHEKVKEICERFCAFREHVEEKYLKNLMYELEVIDVLREDIEKEKNLLERFRRIQVKRGDFELFISELRKMKCKRFATPKDIVVDKVYDSAPVIKRFNELREGALELLVCVREHLYIMNVIIGRKEENNNIDSALNIKEVESVPVLLEFRGTDTETLQPLTDRLLTSVVNIGTIIEQDCLRLLEEFNKTKRQDLIKTQHYVSGMFEAMEVGCVVEKDAELLRELDEELKLYEADADRFNKEMEKECDAYNKSVQGLGVDKQTVAPFAINTEKYDVISALRDEILSVSKRKNDLKERFTKPYKPKTNWDHEFMEILKELDLAESHTASNIGWAAVAFVAMFCISMLAIPFEHITRLFK